ncbi:MAG: transposon-encoded TnpW family protein [Oscillospiraceae bacterium]|nr:transposon-encoded TnpW family protein [Oscillospiraceae bacterium]
MERVDKTAVYLANLSHEKRLGRLKEHQYSRPISFKREIGGTVYTVNAHFSGDTAETAEEKVNRILTRNITL